MLIPFPLDKALLEFSDADLASFLGGLYIKLEKFGEFFFFW